MACRVVIWGLGELFRRNSERFVNEVKQAGGEVCALTASTIPTDSPIPGIALINREDVASLEPDVVVLMTSRFADDVRRDAIEVFGLPQERVVAYDELSQSHVAAGAAACLRANTPSIISNELLGGHIYRAGSLLPASPFVGTQMRWSDFMLIMGDPRHYLCECGPRFLGWRLSDKGEEYPVLAIDDVVINMREADDPQGAVRQWDELRLKVNWENLFFLGVTVSPNEERQMRLIKSGGRQLCLMPSLTCSGQAIAMELEEGERAFIYSANDLPYKQDAALGTLVSALLESTALNGGEDR